MTAPSPMIRPAQAGLTGPVDALQLKVYLGELCGGYERKAQVAPMLFTKTVDHGNSWQMPCYGHVGAGKYHVVGQDVLLDASYLQSLPFVERLFYIDHPFTINGFIPDFEEFQTHYSVREPWNSRTAERHARVSDLKACYALIRSARAAANVPSSGTVTAAQATPAGASALNVGGNTAPAACDNALMRSDGPTIVAALFAAAQRLDENDIPSEGRMALLSPQQYYALVNNRQLLDRDVLKDGGSNGDFADGTVFKCANIRLIKSNAIVDARVNYTKDALELNNYTGDYTKNSGIVFTSESAGRLLRKPMELQMWYEKARFGHVTTTRMIDGFEYKLPEATVELTIP